MDETAESLVSNSLLGLNTSTGRCFKLLAGQTFQCKNSTNLEDDKLQLRDIIWVNPVLCCLTNEILLTTAGRAVPFDWISFRPDQIVKFRKLHNKSVIVIVEERLRFQARSEDRFQMPRCLLLKIED